jgi:hypothetical protein
LPDLFPVIIWLASGLRREKREPARLAEPGMKIRKGIENAVFFMLNNSAIKLNLMPEFLSLLGRAKIR